MNVLDLVVSDEYAEEILNILEQSPSAIDSRDKEGRSALHLACLYGSIDVVGVLLSNKIDVMIFEIEL